MAFLTSLKFSLVMYALLAAFGGFKWVQSATYKTKIAEQSGLIAKQKAAIENWERAVAELEKEKETLSKLITEERIKTNEIETKHSETQTELVNLRGKYDEVKKYLDTNIPDRLALWLCKRYGSQRREGNKTKTTGGVLPENKAACADKYTTNDVMTFVQRQDKVIDQYELKMDLLKLYYEKL